LQQWGVPNGVLQPTRGWWADSWFVGKGDLVVKHLVFHLFILQSLFASRGIFIARSVVLELNTGRPIDTKKGGGLTAHE
jgi:hypothetical protein